MTSALEKIRQQDRRFFITLASIVILTIVAFIILIAARAEAQVGGALTDHSHPGLGRPNSLRLLKPLIDPSGNIVHRNIEIVYTPVLIPASMKSGPILIDNIDIMQVFIPWEFRVAGAFE